MLYVPDAQMHFAHESRPKLPKDHRSHVWASETERKRPLTKSAAAYLHFRDWLFAAWRGEGNKFRRVPCNHGGSPRTRISVETDPADLTVAREVARASLGYY
jgi:hypothetical protein